MHMFHTSLITFISLINTQFIQNTMYGYVKYAFLLLLSGKTLKILSAKGRWDPRLRITVRKLLCVDILGTSDRP